MIFASFEHHQYHHPPFINSSFFPLFKLMETNNVCSAPEHVL